MKKTYLEGGRVCGAHGVRGVIKIESFCDTPRVLAGMKRVFLAVKDGEYEEHKVLTSSVNGPSVLMSVEGIDTREAAIAMKGSFLYLHRDDIPIKKGDMFIADMIGLAVIDADSGRVYGHITAVDDVPRGRLYTIETQRGAVYYPSGEQFIKEIDGDRGMFITPIPGFFEEE